VFFRFFLVSFILFDFAAGVGSRAPQRPGEAKLVAVGVAEMEVALAPRRVARLVIGAQAGGQGSLIDVSSLPEFWHSRQAKSVPESDA
jgi:hypothetical protein